MDIRDVRNPICRSLLLSLFLSLLLCLRLPLLLGGMQALSLCLACMQELLHWIEKLLHPGLHLVGLTIQVGWQEARHLGQLDIKLPGPR